MQSGTHFAKTSDCANEHQMHTLASQAGAFHESKYGKAPAASNGSFGDAGSFYGFSYLRCRIEYQWLGKMNSQQ